jgi:hypothetical protein
LGGKELLGYAVFQGVEAYDGDEPSRLHEREGLWKGAPQAVQLVVDRDPQGLEDPARGVAGTVSTSWRVRVYGLRSRRRTTSLAMRLA